MSDTKIKEGTRVNVYLESGVDCLFDVELIYRPVATGDTFSFRTRNGEVVEVGSFIKMEECIRR